jgi:hypothetical protein
MNLVGTVRPREFSFEDHAGDATRRALLAMKSNRDAALAV